MNQAKRQYNRKITNYDNLTTKQMSTMKHKAKVILSQTIVNHNEGLCVIYPNQETCSNILTGLFACCRTLYVMVLGLVQGGKTGTMSAFIKNYLTWSYNNDCPIPTENVYIITGLSSKEWTEQTSSRLPDAIKPNIYHRDNLNKFVADIKNKKNLLIIIDEVHIAAKYNQSVNKAFKSAGFYDKEFLLENDIKIVEFTATPDGTIYDLMKFGENSHVIKLDAGEGYVGPFDLLNQNRIYQYKDLCGYNEIKDTIDYEMVENNINEIKEVINKNFNEPLYHIIRTPNSTKQDIVIDNFKKFMSNDIKYIKIDSKNDNNINDILKTQPDEHTFIFIKEKFRCSITLYKKYVGIAYERHTFTPPDDQVIIQGILGRICGYDDNGISICFTNIESVRKFKTLWDSNFKSRAVKWKSKTTKRKNNIIVSKGTYNNPELIDGFEVNEDTQIKEPVIKKFKDNNIDELYKNIRLFYKNELVAKLNRCGRGPNKMKVKEDGYYHATIRSNTKVYSCDEIYQERKQGLSTDNYRLYPCYKNTFDKNSLEWWLIYYD